MVIEEKHRGVFVYYLFSMIYDGKQRDENFVR